MLELSDSCLYWCIMHSAWMQFRKVFKKVAWTLVMWKLCSMCDSGSFDWHYELLIKKNICLYHWINKVPMTCNTSVTFKILNGFLLQHPNMADGAVHFKQTVMLCFRFILCYAVHQWWSREIILLMQKFDLTVFIVNWKLTYK